MKRIIFIVLCFVLLAAPAASGFTFDKSPSQSLLGQALMVYMTNGEEFIVIYAEYDLKPGNENTNLYVELVQKAVIRKLKVINFRFPKKDSMGRWLEMPVYYPTEIGIIQKGRDVKVIITKISILKTKPTYHSESVDITEIELNEPKNEPENLAEELIHKAFGCPPTHKMFKK